MKLFNISSLLLLLIFSACQESLSLNLSQTDNELGVKSICCNVPTITFNQAKSIISDTGSFSWQEGDLITIWPGNNFLSDDSTPIAVPFVAKTSGSSAKFEGNGWGLLRGDAYYVAYPFNKDDKYNCVKLDYSKQEQSENGSIGNIGKYDYLFASSTIPSSGEVKFEFKRLGVLMKIVLYVPKDVLFTKLELIADNKLFIRSAQYNPRENEYKLINQNYSRYLTIKLGTNGYYANENGEIVVYFMMSPVLWSGQEITFALVDNSGLLYKTTVIPSADQEAGKGYSVAFHPKKSTEYDKFGDIVDLGLKVCWATKNVGAESPEEYGGYYAWGETKAFGQEDPTNFMNLSYTNNDPLKTYYGPETYKFWRSDKYSPDAKTILDWEDDVANTELDMRMPDQFDWEELCNPNKVTHTYTNDYEGTGVAGTIISSIVPGYEGTSIFIPSNGWKYLSSTFYQGIAGSYWAKDILLDSYGSLFPRHMGFSADISLNGSNPCTNWDPYNGCGVRPVDYSKNVIRKVVIVETLKYAVRMFPHLEVGEQYTLNARVLRTSFWISKEVTWTSSNPEIISIEETGSDNSFEMSYATIKALASGEAKITAVSNADNSEVGEILITVN